MARVLVVDDEQDIRDALRFILEDAGHEVLEATDGENALQVLRASQSSLVVVLDLLMPRLSGIDVLQQVIADPHMKDRHAYLLMTADNALLRQQADTLLAQVSAQVIGKPFDIDALLNMIDQAARFPA
jgi:CheY-like chemotaxis protein